MSKSRPARRPLGRLRSSAVQLIKLYLWWKKRSLSEEQFLAEEEPKDTLVMISEVGS